MRLTTHGARTHGALITYVAPRLAKDAKLPDLAGILAGAPTANRISQRAGIATAIRATSRLAQDADLSDIAELLEAMERVSGEDEAVEPGEAIPMVESDEDLLDRIREFCRGRMRPEDCAKLEEMLGEHGPEGLGDRRRARDDRDDLPRPGGEEAESRTSLARLQNHEPAVGGDRRRARDMTPARAAGVVAHDSLPPERRFPNAARARPEQMTWPSDSRRRDLALDAAAHAGVPAGVKPASERFSFGRRVRPAGAA
jgi:hypothetical protein